MKKPIFLILTLTILIFSFTACEKNDNSSTNALPEQPAASDNGAPPGESIGNESSALPEVSFAATASEMFTNRDKRTTYDDAAIRIQLNTTSATSTSDCVQISGSTVTITEEDTYLLSGNLEDGCIVINADSSAKIHLILDNVTIHSNSSAAILILSADKVTITLAEGQNSLSNGGVFIPVDTVNVNAALYSKDDLSLNGSGSLTITSPAGHGISCKDDLVLAGGTYTITAVNHGLDANNSVRLTSSTISIESGKDGIHAENTDDTTLGFVYIADGTYNIHASDDGISAGAYLQIENGLFDITTESISSATDASGKGLKSTNSMQISNGDFTIHTFDDSIHSNSDIIINGGTFAITAGDDGIHADATLTVTSGNISIAESYEALEALDLIISGGDIHLVASDDGLNAAGGNDGSGFGGRGNDNFGGPKGGTFDDPAANKNNRDFSDFPDGFESIPSELKPGRDMQSRPDKGFGGGFGNNFGGGVGGNFGGMGASNGSITISGGNLYIQASGDGIDANGSLTISGGNITICGPNRGDTASLDYDTTAVINGATFIATGGAGMAQTISSSEQGVITVNVGNQNAGTEITLTDSKGNVLLAQTPELPYNLVILSNPELESGESYTLTVGATTKTFTAQ